MAAKKGAKATHSFFKDSNELHNSVGSFDGGSCLNGHMSKWKERDSCSYRWQGIKRAKESPGPYNSYSPPNKDWSLDGSGLGWVVPDAIAASRAGKILGILKEGIVKGKFKRLIQARNFTNGFAPYGNQVHHVLPNSVLRNGIDETTKSNVDLVKDITDGLLEEKYNINFKVNMLILPTAKPVSVRIGLPTHCGDHPAYSARVTAGVMKAVEPLSLVADQGEEHPEPDYEDLKKDLQAVSSSMYDAIVAYGQANILNQVSVSMNQLPASVFSVLRSDPMKYFSLDPLADFGAGDFCFTDKLPDGIGVRWYRLADGDPFGADYPADPGAVTLRLGDDHRGLKLPSFIGNTGNLLIVDRATADAILAMRTGQIEVLPFVLLDHRGRVHSQNYVFLNPLERIACLNESESVLRRSSKGVLKEVKKPVLDSAERDVDARFLSSRRTA